MVSGRMAGSCSCLMQSLDECNKMSSGMKMQDITHIFMHFWLWFSVKFEYLRVSAQGVKFHFKK